MFNLIDIIQIAFAVIIGVNVYLVLLSWLDGPIRNQGLIGLRSTLTNSAFYLGMLSTLYGMWLGISSKELDLITLQMAFSAAIPSSMIGICIYMISDNLWQCRKNSPKGASLL